MKLQPALNLTDAMLAALVGDDWRACAALAHLRAAELTGSAVAADAADLAQLLARNGELLAGVERLRARTQQELMALRHGSAVRERYRHAGDG
ncbi:MAG: hypothetical protein IT494_02980 [Gammaproteobacteria bacterium]|nr:hypothetical protein [Gammaproteobacteria bacterium]